MRDREEVRAYYETLLGAFPDLELHQQRLYAATDDPAEHAAVWTLRGTVRGPLGMPGIAQPIAPTGDRVHLEGVALMRLRGEQVAHVTQRWDVTGFQRQIGMLPPPGTRADRVLIRLQALGARRRMARAARG